MARVLHLVKGIHDTLARAVIDRQVKAGDQVTVALLGDVDAPVTPGGVTVRRVPDDLSYDDLLEMIFDADQVLTW